MRYRVTIREYKGQVWEVEAPSSQEAARLYRTGRVVEEMQLGRELVGSPVPQRDAEDVVIPDLDHERRARKAHRMHTSPRPGCVMCVAEAR